ncbi:hypothetical protein FQN57_006398 [Myotisia sp. PD_48]|nr:hypothetical protein FQN57_006398 [Myotisia sp. PD_48]
MDVVLYIYDISKGLAKDLSRPITGVQIDAIYHTSLVFGGTEYFFGRGIQQANPGTTHHGQPLEVMPLGSTELPIEVIVEFMQSLADTYTEDSYDLFLRNCNNFTHDLATFLVGRGIPDHIRNLPETFLNTPFGQMMKPYIDGMLRGATQGPESRPVSSTQFKSSAPSPQAFQSSPTPTGRVYNVTDLKHLSSLLASAHSSCAVIFFTSATCPPCKMVYPAYDQLAEEAGEKAFLIKVDISQAYGIASKFDVRKTPTFITFLKGIKDNEWTGANEAQLRGNVRLLVQMAWPPHPHSKLTLPSLEQRVTSYISYKKVPPLEKMRQKLGSCANHPAILDLIESITTANHPQQSNPKLPNIPQFSHFMLSEFPSLPPETHFVVIDLARLLSIDNRFSDALIEQPDHKTLAALLSPAKDPLSCPYNQQLVTTHLACNLFLSTRCREQITRNEMLRKMTINLAMNGLLDSRSNLRAAGASLIYNIATMNHNVRLDSPVSSEEIPESDQFELLASVLESIRGERESPETLRGLLLSLGFLVHLAPVEGEVLELCRAMEAITIVAEKRSIEAFKQEALLTEIGQELLTKGIGSL